MFNQAFDTDASNVNDMTFRQSLSSGDEAAFKIFFEVYEQKIFNYINKIVKSKEVSEELVIDVFMKIWNAKEMLLDIQNLDAFLYRMAVNKALDFLRIATREKKVRELLALEMHSLTSESAEQAYLNREYEQHINLSVKRLPPQQKLIFILSREKGFSHQQIAEELNISKNTVKNHMVSAIKHLRSILKSVILFF